MNAEDSFDRQGLVSLMLNRLQQFTENFNAATFNQATFSQVLELFAMRIDGLAEAAIKSYDYLTYIPAINSALLSVVEKISNVYSNIDYAAIETVCIRLGALTDSMLDIASTPYFPDSELTDNISASIAEATPFMTQEQQQICEDTIAPSLSRKLSLSDMLALLSLLVTILLGLISQLPNEQLDVIIEQQSAQIEVERQENEALLNAIESLTTTVSQLSDKIDLLQEQLDNATDLELKNNELTDGDGLDKTTDTKE